MTIRFVKMHGNGNDFMLINGIAEMDTSELRQALIRQWADRRTGVGFDQLLVVCPPSREDVDFDYRIFNADGSEVAQCANGARCVAHFLRTSGLTDKRRIRVRTAARIIEMTVQDDNKIAVDMGVAVFEPQRIPFHCKGLPTISEGQDGRAYLFNIAGFEFYLSAVSFGNPHAIIRVDDIRTAAVAEIGAALQVHRCFPERVNVSFVEVCDEVLSVRVYERGVGETQACGSGACATAVVARRHGWISPVLHSVMVQLAGGKLEVQFDNERSKLIGAAEQVYTGWIE